MITLDCVRPDHLACYGYAGVETPQLNQVASEGLLFDQAVTHAPNTWVAHATLFTGQLPSVHGLRAPSHRLSTQVKTLAEWLSNHGYATAAFPGNSLVGRAQGFARGFDLFDETGRDQGPSDEAVLWRRDWADVLTKADDWLAASAKPSFIWFHYIETHHLPEYTLPEYFRENFSSLWQHYDGKISYADQVCVGEILRILEECDMRGRTILIVFSDHGEELRPDDRPLHDIGLRDEVIRVPLIIWTPTTRLHASGRISSQVGLVDLFPTACDLLEIPIPMGLQGKSLFPAITGNPRLNDIGGPAYLENWPRGLFGVRTSEWKLIIFHPQPENWESAHPNIIGLFHLPTDPNELSDLSAKHPAVIEQLLPYCAKWARGAPSTELPQEDKEHIERVLQGLGYL